MLWDVSAYLNEMKGEGEGGEWWGVEVLGVCVWVLCGGERVLCVRSVIKVKRE